MKDELLFCPLGGSGEIGMNMNLFAYGKPGEHKWIMVDIGVTFADDTLPGIDLIYPDPGFIVDKKEALGGSGFFASGASFQRSNAHSTPLKNGCALTSSAPPLVPNRSLGSRRSSCESKSFSSGLVGGFDGKLSG